MRIIFLDLDGVVNYTNWYRSKEYSKLDSSNELDIDPKVISRLNKLTNIDDDIYIVISSSWKIASGWKNRLEKAGLKRIYDKTPDYIWFNRKDYCRGWEIDSWLKKHEVENYIIIDDVEDFYEDQLSHFIHVDSIYGFTEDDYKVACTMIVANPKK